MTFKKRKSQQLRNASAVSLESGKKISNDMPLPSFYSRISHQKRAEILDIRANPISKNTLATKFPLRLYGEYHPFVISKPRVPYQLCMYNGREMVDRMTRTEKISLNQD